MMPVRIRYTSPRPTIAVSPVSVKPARPSVWRGDLGHRIPYFWCVQTGNWAANMSPAERGSCMSKHGSVSAVLLGLSMIVLAGCTGAPIGTAPDIPGEASGSTSVGANPLATSAAPVTSASTTTRSETTARPSTRSAPGARPSTRSAPAARPSTRSAPGARPSPSSDSFVQANSIPFPVAVGNTWLYQTTAVGQTGQTTNRIVAAGAVPAGYEVTISSTTNVPAAAAAAQSVYLFHPDGTVGIPEPALSGVSVVGGGIRWPDAAALASGRAYHSVLRLRVDQTGQYEDASVTVQGAGTTSVSVPAGAYQTSVVDTIIVSKAITVAVTTWIAQGIGPVRTAVVIRAAGTTELTTNQLLSFTKGAMGIGSLNQCYSVAAPHDLLRLE